MSLGLQATKRRITSVNSTKKITKAMQLVASAKLKSMKKNLASTTAYAEEVGFVMAMLAKKIDTKEFNSIFSISADQEDAVCYLVISSSLGLCGGYNYNLFKSVTGEINKDKDIIVAIGSKAQSYYKIRGYNVIDEYVDDFNTIDYKNVNKLAKGLLSLYTSGKCKKIRIAYTHYKNQITFIPTLDDLFPFDSANFKQEITAKEMNMLVEPDAVSIVKKLLPLYLKSIIFARLSESSLSEYSSRRNAMENATDNAEEIVQSLQIEYNKARQGAITQEITEVVGGANASE